MSANERLRARGAARARRIRAAFAYETRHARIRAGLSQEEVGRRVGMSGDKIWQIEHESLPSLSITDACLVGAVLGLDFAARVFPNDGLVRDAGQARRLSRILTNVGAPLSSRTDVPLPAAEGRRELRAWDALILGLGERTGVELEARLHDLQEMTRRHNLKRRDDPVDHFLLALADTVHNRRVVGEYRELFGDLPRLRTANVLAGLRSGVHPPTGFILI